MRGRPQRAVSPGPRHCQPGFAGSWLAASVCRGHRGSASEGVSMVACLSLPQRQRHAHNRCLRTPHMASVAQRAPVYVSAWHCTHHQARSLGGPPGWRAVLVGATAPGPAHGRLKLRAWWPIRSCEGDVGASTQCIYSASLTTHDYPIHAKRIVADADVSHAAEGGSTPTVALLGQRTTSLGMDKTTERVDTWRAPALTTAGAAVPSPSSRGRASLTVKNRPPATSR